MLRLALSLLLIDLSLPVTATEWHGTDASTFTFEVAFEGVPTPGEFREFDVVLEFDSVSPASGRLRVSVDLKAADMGDPDMNDVLFDRAWLNVDRFTQSLFVSDEIEEQAPGKFVATGTLDLKGVVRTVVVPFTWRSSGATATLSGSLVLRRTDFDVGSGEWATDEAIGIDVTLNFDVQLLRRD